MADGKVVVETELNDKGIKKGVNSAEKNVRKTFSQMAKESGKTVDEIKKDVSNLAKEYQKQGVNIPNSYKKAYKKMGLYSKDTAKDMKEDQEDIGEAAEKSSKKTHSVWKTAFAKIGGLSAKAGATLVKGTATAIMGASAAVTGLSAAAIKVGSDFESQMSRVQAISGATGEEFQRLHDQALQLGADTAFSAGEAAQGMENLAAAGFNVDETLVAMPGLLDLAAASGEDLATSSDIAASTLRGFGLEASEAGHVANVLAENANRTNSSVRSTGEAMKYIAPVAHAMGISMEETAAAIGIMADAGIQGSQAGTTLRGAFSRLVKPTDDMAKKMQELGLEFFDANGKMKPLKEQIEMLKTATAGLTDEERNNALVTLYGQESLSGMLALVSAGPEKLDELTTSFENSEGAAQKAAVTMQDNFKGAVEQLGGSLETLGILVYEKMSEPLKNMAQFGTEAVNSMTEAFKKDGVKGIVSSIGDILGNVTVAVAEKAPVMAESGVQIVTQLLTGLNENSEKLGTSALSILSALGNGILTILPQVGELGLNLVSALSDGIANNAPAIVSSGFELLHNLATGILSAAPEIFSAGAAIITSVYEYLSANMPGFLQSGYEILSEIVTGFVNAIPEKLPLILDFIQGIGTKLSEFAPVLIAKGFELLGKLVEGIVTALPILIAKVPTIISTFAGIINDNFPTILKKGFELLTQLLKGILQAIPTLIKNIPKIVKAIVDVITAFNWWQLGSKIITFFKNGIMGMIHAVKGAGTSIFNAIKNAIINLPQTLKNLGTKAMNGLGGAISSMLGFIKTKATGIVNTIFETISSLPGKMLDIGKNIVSGLWNGISNMTGWVIEKIKGFGSNILNGFEDFFDINSPSKVMEKRVGKYMAQGIGVGFIKNSPMPQIEKSLDLGMRGIRHVVQPPANSTTYNNQTNKFYGVQTPDQVARTLRLQQEYGLAGAY